MAALSFKKRNRLAKAFAFVSSGVLTVCANCTSTGVYPRFWSISGMPKASVSSWSWSRVLASSVLRWIPSMMKNGRLSAILNAAASSTTGLITLNRTIAGSWDVVVFPSLMAQVAC